MTPDPVFSLVPAERFQRGWNRTFLLGQVGALAVMAATALAERAALPLPAGVTAASGSFAALVGVVSVAGGFVLPAASFVAGRVAAGRAGVTDMLAAGAVAVGLVMGLVGVGDLLREGSGPVRLLAGVVAAMGGVVAVVALVGGVGGRGRWPGFGAAVAGALAALVLALVPTSYYAPEAARVGTVRSDLRDLHRDQEIHHGASGGYASELAELGFTPTAGVTVTLTRTGDGWLARGHHFGVDAECAVYVGSTPASPAEREGEIACLPTPQHFRDGTRPRYRLAVLGGVLGSFLVVLALALHGVRREPKRPDRPSPPR